MWESFTFARHRHAALFRRLRYPPATLTFATPFQRVAAGMPAMHDVLFRFALFAAQHASATAGRRVDSGQTTREALVNLALRLNVLAVCAVFAFVGAVLLGAF